MSATAEVQSGLEGVVAFATEIAEPDREGGALRYRGVDIEELVGQVPFEQVWGLLVDGQLLPGLPPAEPHPLHVHSGDPRVDVQSALAMLAPQWGFGQLIDISDEEARDNVARASVMALSFVAQSARGFGKPPVSQREIDEATSIPERFLIRWRGEADPRHVKAIDAYWNSAAEPGMNASTFTARVVASTGADVAAALSAAVGALSGPLPGGAPSRVLGMLDQIDVGGIDHVLNDHRTDTPGLTLAADKIQEDSRLGDIYREAFGQKFVDGDTKYFVQASRSCYEVRAGNFCRQRISAGLL